MTENAKLFNNPEDFNMASRAMATYQLIHNILRTDYEQLLEITESEIDNNAKFFTLYRASLKGFFSIIESDIYGLNNIDKYPNYKDRDTFEVKFKNTFKQVGGTWGKEIDQKKYFDTKYSTLKALRKLRDKLLHPKRLEDIPVVDSEKFYILKKAFIDYNEFINGLMNNFFIQLKISTKEKGL